MRVDTTGRRRRGALGVVVGTLAVAVAVLQPSPVAAALTLVPAPNFPSSVTVGQQFTGMLDVFNVSSPPENAQPVTVGDIVLVPACTTSTVDCAGGVDAGVFSLGATGTGSGACTGTTFAINQSSPGVFRLTPPFSLPAARSCGIQFTVTVLKVPTVDTAAGTPGVQTQVRAAATATSPAPGTQPVRASSVDVVTVNRAVTGIVTQATPATAQVGQLLQDTATLTGAVNPTGTVTFVLYRDTRCAVEVFRSTVPVSASGTSTSNSYTAVAAGTYRWVGTYSGDVNNLPAGPPACQDPAETVVVQRANPQITTLATPANSIVGAPVRDTATVGGGFNPTGTVLFELFSDPSCAIQVFSSTNPLDPSTRVATSGPFTPPTVGTYRWRASYSGDVNNSPVGPTACGDPLETVTVRAAPQARPPADFNGDARTDVSVFRPGNGAWFVRGSAGTDMGVVYGGLGGDLAVPADYDGDSRVDVAIYRPSNGGWFVRGSAGTDFGILYGFPGDIPVPGDYDGDRRADVAVYRPGPGSWFVHGSAGVDRSVVYGGEPGDVPVPADYDGDGRVDVAIYRPSNGGWFVRGSAGTDMGVVYGGVAGDVPVPGDYDGDNKVDIAIYRPGNGGWFVRASGGTDFGVLFGSPGDRPVPGDYDGDRRTDVAVYRPATGTWFVRSSSSGAISSVVYGGVAGDVPLPLPAAVRRAYFSGA